MEKNSIRKRRGKEEEYIIDGQTSIEEISKNLGINIEEGEYQTLNGFMISRMDRLPEKNERFKTECDGYVFEILSVENRMVKKVAVKKADNESKVKEEESN